MRCSLGVCGRLFAPSQQLRENIVRPCHSSRICAAREQERVLVCTEEKMVKYIQFGSVRYSFLRYKNVTSKVRGPERGKRLIVVMMERCRAGAARRLRSEQKSNSLLLEKMSLFLPAEGPERRLGCKNFFDGEDLFSSTLQLSVGRVRDIFRVLTWSKTNLHEAFCEGCSRCWDRC